MAEQAVQLLRVVSGTDTAVGEQTVGLVSFVDEGGQPVNVAGVPAQPEDDGTYTLQVVVADGEAAYSWVSA